MANVQKFDHATLRTIGAAIDDALRGVAERYGVTVRNAGCRFLADRATFKVEVGTVTADASGAAVTAERREYEGGAAMFDLKPEWFGQTFRIEREEYRVVGLKWRSRRFPVVVDRVRDGKRFKFPASAVRTAFGLSTAA